MFVGWCWRGFATFRLRAGHGKPGVVDALAGLGRPFPFTWSPPPPILDPLAARLEPQLKPYESRIVQGLIKEGKLRDNLHVHEFIRAVKYTIDGRPLPEAFRPPDLTAIPPEGTAVPHLTVKYKSTAGRSTLTGRITTRHRGGGDPRLLYVVDRHRSTTNIPQKVVRFEEQPRRSAQLALVQNMEGPPLVSYILAPHELKVGDILPNDGKSVVPGNCLQLSDIPVGTFVYNVELYPGYGGALARSAGSKAKFLGLDASGTKAILEMPSKRQKLVDISCRACIGQTSNLEWRSRVLGKAGARRRLGWRPTVRGVAMNPIAHPHGGGKGGESKGNISQSPWCKPAKKRRFVKRPARVYPFPVSRPN